jgi:hypothetical protein
VRTPSGHWRPGKSAAHTGKARTAAILRPKSAAGDSDGVARIHQQPAGSGAAEAVRVGVRGPAAVEVSPVGGRRSRAGVAGCSKATKLMEVAMKRRCSARAFNVSDEAMHTRRVPSKTASSPAYFMPGKVRGNASRAAAPL